MVCWFILFNFQFDKNEWSKKIQFFSNGNTTFLEAYIKTGRILNITVVSNDG
jgi:hypothetical protein